MPDEAINLGETCLYPNGILFLENHLSRLLYELSKYGYYNEHWDINH